MLALMRNKFGFTLVEITVAIGLAGAISILIFSLMQNAQKNAILLKQDYSIRLVTDEIRKILNNPRHCQASLTKDSNNADINISTLPTPAAPLPATSQLVIRLARKIGTTTDIYGPTVDKSFGPGVIPQGLEQVKMTELKIIGRIDMGSPPHDPQLQMHNITIRATIVRAKSRQDSGSPSAEFYSEDEQSPVHTVFNINVITNNNIIQSCDGDITRYEQETCSVANGVWDNVQKKCSLTELCFVNPDYLTFATTIPKFCLKNYAEEEILTKDCAWTPVNGDSCPPGKLLIGIDPNTSSVMCCDLILNFQ